MLPYKLFICADPMAYFEWPLFKFWLKACFQYQLVASLHVVSVSARKFYLRAKVAPEDLF